MVRQRELQAELEAILGSRNVYFQPPATIKMSYPCFVYNRSRVESVRADNLSYVKHDRYMVTYISRDPDDNLNMVHTMLEHFPRCMHDRFYTADNLSHDVFDLYY